jgi:transposase
MSVLVAALMRLSQSASGTKQPIEYGKAQRRGQHALASRNVSHSALQIRVLAAQSAELIPETVVPDQAKGAAAKVATIHACCAPALASAILVTQ